MLTLADASWDEFWKALVGVIAGGIVTIVTTLYLNRQSARVDSKKERCRKLLDGYGAFVATGNNYLRKSLTVNFQSPPTTGDEGSRSRMDISDTEKEEALVDLHKAFTMVYALEPCPVCRAAIKERFDEMSSRTENFADTFSAAKGQVDALMKSLTTWLVTSIDRVSRDEEAANESHLSS